MIAQNWFSFEVQATKLEITSRTIKKYLERVCSDIAISSWVQGQFHPESNLRITFLDRMSNSGILKHAFLYTQNYEKNYETIIIQGCYGFGDADSNKVEQQYKTKDCGIFSIPMIRGAGD